MFNVVYHEFLAPATTTAMVATVMNKSVTPKKKASYEDEEEHDSVIFSWAHVISGSMEMLGIVEIVGINASSDSIVMFGIVDIVETVDMVGKDGANILFVIIVSIISSIYLVGH